MWQSMKRCLRMGDQCHWLPVREKEEKTGLQVKENEDTGSWEGSPGLPWFQGANIGGNSEECRLVQDHLIVSTGAVSSAQETPFSQSHLSSTPGGGSQDASWYRWAELMDAASRPMVSLECCIGGIAFSTVLW